MKKVLLSFVCDIVAAVLVLTGIWFFDYQAVQPGTPAISPQISQSSLKSTQMTVLPENSPDIPMVTVSSNHTENNSTGKLVQTNMKLDTQDWHTKFADHFTDQVVSTDTSYTSPDLSIQLSCGSME